MSEQVRALVAASLEVKRAMLEDAALLAAIEEAAARCAGTLARGGRILLAGNGGSAADAQHIAAELVGRFSGERRALPAIALTTNTSTLTAVANDYGYEHVFARALEGLASRGDVFIGISTSGSSPNVLAAIDTAARLGVETIGLTGRRGGAMAGRCGLCLRVPSDETPRIQEGHILIGHILCARIEARLFGERGQA
ncbi:D-sedoheptulose-7-phosphate isomerase [Inmirania thermothiophila]|uniref:Phosphoheptose isomerase n=1 Tax=Inmirania thermothiophila TaxID=1750597 RepID=A0A3N1XSJ7_9GAMM|nr:D-sedoheptulose 7-phosphate isomerase [Inmirania thermothiophila]ROR29615.1 phosphoheptose isomerase [Inmirania thermothiophila]